MSIYCPKCGEELTDDSKFCKKCGATQPQQPIGVTAEQRNLKKPLLIIGSAVIVIALIFVLLLATVEVRIYGTWEREVMYLPAYGCDAIMTVTFDKDGSAVEVLTNADSGEVLHMETGSWRVKGFTVQYVEDGENYSDGHTPYTFNPLTGKLKNNLLYTKIS